MRKKTSEVLEIVGPQEYTLALEGPIPGINPLEAWSAPSHKRIFTVDEMYDIFSKECIAFIGDSTDRRAADTLQILLSNRHNISGIAKYFYRYDNKDAPHSRLSIVDGVRRTKECSPGTIDNMFLPVYDKLLIYKYQDYKNYDVIVASTGPWNHKKKLFTPRETRERIQQVINYLHNEIPKDVLLIWKTSAWSWFGEWEELKENETTVELKDNNFLVHYANQVAKETILAINSTRRIVVDFSTEIAPYSWEYRISTNMAAEKDDWVPWHLGPKARALLAQMVTWEVARYRNSTLLSAGIDNGSGVIESGKTYSQSSNGTFHEPVASEITSGSSSIHNDYKNSEIDVNSTTVQDTDPPVEKSVDHGKSESEKSNKVDSDDAEKSDSGNTTRSGTFSGNTSTAVSEPVVGSSAVGKYIKASDRVPERPTLMQNPMPSVSRNILGFGAVLIILYGARMRSRRKSRAR